MALTRSPIDENKLLQVDFILAIVELTTGVATATSIIEFEEVAGLKDL